MSESALGPQHTRFVYGPAFLSQTALARMPFLARVLSAQPHLALAFSRISPSPPFSCNPNTSRRVSSSITLRLNVFYTRKVRTRYGVGSFVRE